MTNLKEIVERYASLARNFGEPVLLSTFGWSGEETERLFSGFDEDYHISRYLHFSRLEGEEYLVSGATVTHVSMHEGIRTVL